MKGEIFSLDIQYLKVLSALKKKPLTGSEILEKYDIAESSLFRALREMKKIGLVSVVGKKFNKGVTVQRGNIYQSNVGSIWIHIEEGVVVVNFQLHGSVHVETMSIHKEP